MDSRFGCGPWNRLRCIPGYGLVERPGYKLGHGSRYELAYMAGCMLGYRIGYENGGIGGGDLSAGVESLVSGVVPGS